MQQQRSVFGALKQVLFATVDTAVNTIGVVDDIAGGCKAYSSEFRLDAEFDTEVQSHARNKRRAEFAAELNQAA